ncbi:MAG TPA: radical SAM protein [Proteobacteria bacterium]|nr:radical SAM protein [Pseudomonadota bacterium]
MSRVLLISNNRATTPYPVYPLGMAVVAGALTQAGHEVAQWDLLTATDAARRDGREDAEAALLLTIIAEFRPDFICLSLRNIDNTDSFSGAAGWYLESARQTLAILRELSPVPLILGGPAFSLMPEDILAYLGADYGIVGEGEEALPRLIAALAAGENPPPLLRGKAPLSGEQFSSPRFHAEILTFYKSGSNLANLQSKRGCPHHCTYCTYPALEGRNFRRRPAAAVVDDIVRLQQEHGVSSLFFVDSVFNDGGRHHLAIAEEILSRSLKISWSAFFRPAGLPLRDLQLLRRAGLFALELGSDALTATTLQGLGKGFTFADIQATHQACRQLQLPVAHYLVFGGPDESPATLRQGLARLDRLQGGVLFIFSGLRLLPDTKLHQRVLQEGRLTPETKLLRPYYYFSPLIDPTTMNEAISAACKGRRERLFPPEEALVRLKIMRRFGFQGLLWNQLLKRP